MIAYAAEGSMPLQGVKVLELGSLIAGPYASALLAQFGIEELRHRESTGVMPVTGSPSR